MGGWSRTGDVWFNDVWRYRPSKGTWSKVDVAGMQTPEARKGATLTAVNGRLILFGGQSKRGVYLHDVWALLPIGGGTRPPHRVNWTGVRSRLAVAARFDISRFSSLDLERGLVWTELTPASREGPRGRYQHAACELNGFLLVSGGRVPRALDDHWLFDLGMYHSTRRR